MPSPALLEWHLCVDGGGTAVKVVVASSDGQQSGASGGPCNVKSVGPHGAIATIVAATREALLQIPDVVPYLETYDPLLLPTGLFKSAWIALAGIQGKSDVDELRPLACAALGFALGDSRLSITNDGELLGAPCLTMPHVDTAITVVAGTGSVVLAFDKTIATGKLQLIGVDGGWGYLLGDEGSGTDVGRLAIRRILAAHDADITRAIRYPTSCASPRLPLFVDLLDTFGVPNAPELVNRTYSDHSLPVSPVSLTYASSESNRKLWMAAAAPIVLGYAFGGPQLDPQSVQMARGIVTEAVAPLVDSVERLVGDKMHVNPQRALLSLGGGMWRTPGYRDLLVQGLKARGLAFAEVKVVESAAAEGARALCARVVP